MQWNEEKPMNILIIGRKFEAISDVKTYTEMWAYNLACAFSEAGVTNGAKVIHIRRLKSDPGVNLLS